MVVLCVPVVHSLLVAKTLCSRGVPLRGLQASFCGRGILICVVWKAWLAHSLISCQALTCANALGCWLVGSGHEAAACRNLGGLEADAAYWWAEFGPEDSWALTPSCSAVIVTLLKGRDRSWNPAIGPRDP